MPVLIQEVLHRSPAARAGVQPGETLCSINGNSIADVLDYRFYSTDVRLELALTALDGSSRLVRLRKGEYEDLGLEFETYLMDRQHTCTNNCVFCFVNQMPPGMRESLYFKDDDSRMSFLFGNYITMTNLSEEDVTRIIKMRISPVNVSIHSTDPDLRVSMMKNPAAASSLSYLQRLADADIHMNTQLVLCPGINDGPALTRSIRDLAALYPAVQSIACVPVGLTKFREGLPQLRCYTRAEASALVAQVHAEAARLVEQHGEPIVYPADEFFLLGGEPVPDASYYGAFDQLENGVGLLALLKQEFEEALEEEAAEPRPIPPRLVTMATGTAAADWLRALAEQAMARFPGLDCKVLAIRNDFFGETVTVAGLVTATDLMAQLRGKNLGDEVLITSSMLRHEQDRFLDDHTLEDVAQALGVPVQVVDNDGRDLLLHMRGNAAQ